MEPTNPKNMNRTPKPPGLHINLSGQAEKQKGLEKQATLAKLQKTIEDNQKWLEENRKAQEEDEILIKGLREELAKLRREPETIKEEPDEKRATTHKKPDTQPKKESMEVSEPKIFSSEFVSDRMRTLLESNKNIKEIKHLEVRGTRNEIILNLRVLAGPLGLEVGVEAILESKAGNIKVKNHKIDAGWMIKGTVEGIIAPKLNEVSELLKSYIEKEEKRKVAKMEIINGELEVTFL